jgi:hypothetical protein
MNKTAKGLLIGCGVLVLLAAVAIFLGIRYLSANKDQILARGKELRAAGEAYGRTRREPECVAEALTRYRGDRSMMGAIRSRLWLSGCLHTAAPDPEFCSNVPPSSEIIRSATWRVAQCGKYAMQGDSSCPNILDEVQTYCESSQRAKKLSPE